MELPTDILKLLVTSLPYRSILSLGQVNQQFAMLCASDDVWKYKLEQRLRTPVSAHSYRELYKLHINSGIVGKRRDAIKATAIDKDRHVVLTATGQCILVRQGVETVLRDGAKDYVVSSDCHWVAILVDMEVVLAVSMTVLPYVLSVAYKVPNIARLVSYKQLGIVYLTEDNSVFTLNCLDSAVSKYPIYENVASCFSGKCISVCTRDGLAMVQHKVVATNAKQCIAYGDRVWLLTREGELLVRNKNKSWWSFWRMHNWRVVSQYIVRIGPYHSSILALTQGGCLYHYYVTDEVYSAALLDIGVLWIDEQRESMVPIWIRRLDD
jgi:hypothetical protein